MLSRFGVLLLLATPSAVLAQEAMYTQAATMPSKGVTILRPTLHLAQYGTNPINASEQRTTRELEAMAGVQYGLGGGLSITLDVPVMFERTEDATGAIDNDKGVGDIMAMFKYRVYMDNPGGVDTMRIAILGGADIASGDDKDFSSGSINPMVGGVLTVVRGRNGFNLDAMYKYNTGGERLSNDGGDGPDDALTVGTAWVYRIVPSAFTAETVGAWYTTLEVNSMYETNGDIDVRWAPGIMYEGRLWAFEAMLQFPLWHDLDERAELDWAAGVGLRFTF